MNDLERLTHIIHSILSSDQAISKKADAELSKFREADINQYTLQFANLIKASPEYDIKMVSFAHLTRIFSNDKEETEKEPERDIEKESRSKWYVLAPNTQKQIKEIVLSLLKDTDFHKEPPKGKKAHRLTDLLCDFIGELAVVIKGFGLDQDKKMQLDGEDKEWESLHDTLSEFLESEDYFLKECALRILTILFEKGGRAYAAYKDKLPTVLEEIFTEGTPEQNIVAMSTFYSFIKEIKFKDCKNFMDLPPLMLTQVLLIANKNQDLAIEALQIIGDILEVEARILEKNHKQLVQILKGILSLNNVTDELKESALLTLVLSIEQLPKGYYEDPYDTLRDALDIILNYMVKNDKEPDEQWLNPKKKDFLDEFDVDEVEDSLTRFGMELVARTVVALNKKKTPTPQIAFDIMIDYANNNKATWQHQHCGLMCASQIGGETVEDLSQIESSVAKILSFFKNDHPKVRYAALHCIGQIATQPKIDFKANDCKTILPEVISMLNDKYTRVASCALKALTSLLYECPKEIAIEFLEEILEPCIAFIRQESLIVTQNSLKVICNLATACEANFNPYSERTREAILPLLSTSKKELEHIKEEASETLSLIDEGVDRSELKKMMSYSGTERTTEVPTSDFGDVSTDYEMVPLAQGRKRRNNKKPLNAYEEKPIEEHKEKPKKAAAKTTVTTKKPKEQKGETTAEETQMEIEKANAKARTEIGYEWREAQLAFREAMGSLSEEEFVGFIKMVQEERPECVSFEKGFLELKITGASDVQMISQNPYSKTNQMMIQTKIFLDFVGYIEKIKGGSNNNKSKSKKIVKVKN